VIREESRMTNRVRSLPFFLLVALVASSLPARAADTGPVEVPVLAALSGPLAFYGSAVGKGLEMMSAAINKQGGVNGRPIKFVILDQQSNPQVAAQLMSQQIAKGAQIVMDAGGGSSCLGAQSQLQANGPVLYCMTPVVHPPPGSYTFVATTPGFYDQYAVIVRYFRLRGFTKIGLISSTDATGQESERLVDQIAQLPENKSLTITNHERMALSDLSATAQIERIKASGAQAIIAGTTGTAYQTILRGMRDAGLELPVAASAGNLSYRQMEAFASSLPKSDVLVPGFSVYARDQIAGVPALRKVVDQFWDVMKANDIPKPEVGYATAWDQGLVVVDALRRTGANATAAQIHNYMLNLRGLTGLFGTLDFKAAPQSGASKRWIFMMRWDPTTNNFVVVSSSGGDPLKR
jgi:branched-chain amino acid transport system substrate-binding protein